MQPGRLWHRSANAPLPCRECKSGAGLWEVLQLDSSYDLDEHLRTPKVRAGSRQSCCSGRGMHQLYWAYWEPCRTPRPTLQYTADLQKRLGGFTAGLGDVRLLRSEGRQDLETFARSGLDELDYGRFQEEVRGARREPDPAAGRGAGFWAAPDSVSPQLKNPVVQTSLPGLARSLEGLQKMQVSGGAGRGGSWSPRGPQGRADPAVPRRGTARWPGGSQPRRGRCGTCRTPRCRRRRLWW